MCSTKVTNNRATVPLATVVTDIAGSENQYTLDTHGFQLVRHQSREATFSDEAALTTDYYAEMEQLYKDVTGASLVFIFGHRVRRGPSHWHSLGEGNAANRGPLHRVHVDQSYDGALLVAQKHLPESDLAALLERRFQIVNIWRPLREVRKDPLGVADARSVLDEDLVAASVMYQDGSRSETWAVRPSEGHRWFFKGSQRPDEVLFIKCFDSAVEEGLARRTPHCAFRDPEYDEAESRESVEVRAMLFY